MVMTIKAQQPTSTKIIVNATTNLEATVSTANSSTTNLAAGNSYTFTGTAELNSSPDVMVNLYMDQDGTLSIQFSTDGTNWDSTVSKSVTASTNEFTTAVKGSRYVRVVVTTASLTTTVFRLQTQFGIFRQGNLSLNRSVTLDSDAVVSRPTSFQDEVTIGRRTGVTPFTKFAYRTNLSSAGGEETVWAYNGNYTVPTSASTYTITYDGTSGGSTDGASTNGARSLIFYHIDENGLPETITHTLGTDGSDETSFSGLGINRVVVLSAGSATYNQSAITITHTSSGNVVAYIPAQESVTQQAIFHVGSNHDAACKFLMFNVNRLAGSNPKVTIKGYVYNRNIGVRFEIFRHYIDTATENTVMINEPVNFKLSAADVLYFVADTDQNNTMITMRFSLNEYQRT